MKKSKVAIPLLVIVFALSAPAALFGPDTFQEAYRVGAKAKVNFKVVDDVGNPVQGAIVNVFFDMADRSKGQRLIDTTDTNGVFVAEEKTKGVLEIMVSRDGYYATNDEISFIDMGREHEVVDGKWQPWGMPKTIVLRKKKNPIAVRVGMHDWRLTKALNTWIGFDLEKYDYVEPIGRGKVCDFEVKFDWDGMFGTKHNGMAVSLRFTDKFSGGYYENRFLQSAFTGVYAADPQKTYLQYFHYFRRPIRDAKGRKIGGEGERFDKSKVLVVRSRCVVDEEGNLVSARYFEIENFEFSCSREKEVALCFNLTYNSTPNDTNLEPK